MPNEMVPQSGQRVDASEREQRIGEIAVDILRGMKHCTVGFDPKIDLEDAKIESAAVPDEGDDTDLGMMNIKA